MYVIKEEAKKKLNLSEEEFSYFVSLHHIKYSEKTDKYDPDSILEKRTMTIGIEKYLSEELKAEIIEKMGRYSSMKHKLVKDLQHEVEYKNSGVERAHRKIGVEYGFGVHIADSALATASGLVKGAETWYKKRIENLEKKIIKKTEELEKILKENKEKEFHDKYEKGKKQQIHILKNKLAKYQGKGYIPIHFGKNSSTKEEYRRNRLEYFSSGSTSAKGNPEIRFEYIKKLDSIKLKLFNYYFDVQIPKSHEKTFSLNNYNCQSSRISYNKKGKLVLHITYSYIKPVEKRKIEKSKGTIGIDIGPKEIAVCMVKNDGNPFKYIHFSTGNLLDKRTEETEREISLILDQIIKIGEENGFTHITIENLNFKENYKYKNKELNRMLSKFPYRKFEELITSKCNRRGIKLKKVNPAYTSVIGIYKYSNRDNLSPKHTSKSKDLSAALAIGRRGLGFVERAIVCIKVSSKTKSLKLRSLFPESEKDGKKTAKKRGSCNWYLWNQLKRGKTIEQLTALLFESEKDQFFITQEAL